MMTILESNGFHPRTRDEYIVKGGIRTKRVVRNIFFMSDEQIRLVRRFVSGFLYETNATFNTNTRRLPLSVIVGIDNTKHTFPMAFMFITTELAKSFKFIRECLIDLCFYDCLQPSLIYGDFSKGLRAAVTAQRAKDLVKDIKDNNGFIDIDDVADDSEAEHSGEFLEGTIVVDVAVETKGERTRLQLCEWHTIKAIKRRLIHSGRYSKETRLVLIDLINKQIKASDLEALETARTTLFSRLQRQERHYLRSFYQPKESQFCHAYTRLLPNLGVNSTQRGESYYVVVKVKLYKNLTVSATYKAIITKTKKLAEEYNERINENRKTDPILIDKKAF